MSSTLNRYISDSMATVTLHKPKHVATIKLCGGGLTFHITDMMEFTMPTEEQRKNLKEMLCIEVIPINENTD